MEAWLKEQAIAEATSRGDDWNLMQFQAMKAGKLTTADKDVANLYLFGEEDPKFTSTGAVERSHLTQQNDKEDARPGGRQVGTLKGRALHNRITDISREAHFAH